jgi:hypothetical protein
VLSTSYNILSKTLLSRLSPYAEEIIGDQCGFQHNILTTYRSKFLHSPDTGEKQEYSETEVVSFEHGNEPSGFIECC